MYDGEPQETEQPEDGCCVDLWFNTTCGPFLLMAIIVLIFLIFFGYGNLNSLEHVLFPEFTLGLT